MVFHSSATETNGSMGHAPSQSRIATKGETHHHLRSFCIKTILQASEFIATLRASVTHQSAAAQAEALKVSVDMPFWHTFLGAAVPTCHHVQVRLSNLGPGSPPQNSPSWRRCAGPPLQILESWAKQLCHIL